MVQITTLIESIGWVLLGAAVVAMSLWLWLRLVRVLSPGTGIRINKNIARVRMSRWLAGIRFGRLDEGWWLCLYELADSRGKVLTSEWAWVEYFDWRGSGWDYCL
jgi:hypothetical protein